MPKIEQLFLIKVHMATEKIIQEFEDEEDIREAEIALKEIEENGSIPFEEMKTRIKLIDEFSFRTDK